MDEFVYVVLQVLSHIFLTQILHDDISLCIIMMAQLRARDEQDQITRHENPPSEEDEEIGLYRNMNTVCHFDTVHDRSQL